MTNPFRDQEKFMKACDQITDEVNVDQFALYVKLINEECNELIEAITANDHVETLDALTDILVVTIGAIHSMGADAEGAWKEAIEKLRMFRQGVEVGRNPGVQPNRPGRSRWPEADSIREITGHHSAGHTPTHPARLAFPRAVFGLPIITHYNNNHEPPDTTLSPLLVGMIVGALVIILYLPIFHLGQIV